MSEGDERNNQGEDTAEPRHGTEDEEEETEEEEEEEEQEEENLNQAADKEQVTTESLSIPQMTTLKEEVTATAVHVGGNADPEAFFPQRGEDQSGEEIEDRGTDETEASMLLDVQQDHREKDQRREREQQLDDNDNVGIDDDDDEPIPKHQSKRMKLGRSVDEYDSTVLPQSSRHEDRPREGGLPTLALYQAMSSTDKVYPQPNSMPPTWSGGGGGGVGGYPPPPSSTGYPPYPQHYYPSQQHQQQHGIPAAPVVPGFHHPPPPPYGSDPAYSVYASPYAPSLEGPDARRSEHYEWWSQYHRRYREIMEYAAAAAAAPGTTPSPPPPPPNPWVLPNLPLPPDMAATAAAAATASVPSSTRTMVNVSSSPPKKRSQHHHISSSSPSNSMGHSSSHYHHYYHQQYHNHATAAAPAEYAAFEVPERPHPGGEPKSPSDLPVRSHGV